MSGAGLALKLLYYFTSAILLLKSDSLLGLNCFLCGYFYVKEFDIISRATFRFSMALPLRIKRVLKEFHAITHQKTSVLWKLFPILFSAMNQSCDDSSRTNRCNEATFPVLCEKWNVTISELFSIRIYLNNSEVYLCDSIVKGVIEGFLGVIEKEKPNIYLMINTKQIRRICLFFLSQNL